MQEEEAIEKRNRDFLFFGVVSYYALYFFSISNLSRFFTMNAKLNKGDLNLCNGGMDVQKRKSLWIMGRRIRRDREERQ